MSASVLGVGSLVAVLNAMLLFLAPPVVAQEAREVAEATPVRPIVIEALVSLGDEGEGYVDGNSSIAGFPGGGFVVAPVSRPGELVIFHEDGTYRTVFGRRGEGPGEFKRIHKVLSGAKYLHVLDVGNLRWTVLSAGGSWVRTTPFPARLIDGIVAGDSMLVMSASIPTATRVGYPLHILSQEGDITHSFGYDDAKPFRQDLGLKSRKVLADPGDATFWSVDRNAYRMEHWSMTGDPIQILERNPEWFQSWSGSVESGEGVPALDPFIQAAAFDQEGLLWIAAAIPDAGLPERLSAESPNLEDPDPNRLFDTVIEVIDVERGLVVASARSDFFVTLFLGGRRFATNDLADTAFPRVRIWLGSF